MGIGIVLSSSEVALRLEGLIDITKVGTIRILATRVIISFQSS